MLSGICGGFESVDNAQFTLTLKNQDFEMALISANNKGLLQTWYQLDGGAQPPCYGLQPAANIFIQNRDN